MRAGSENFARLVDYQDAYAAGVRRFDTSLRANPVLICMLEAACQLLLDWQCSQRYTIQKDGMRLLTERKYRS